MKLSLIFLIPLALLTFGCASSNMQVAKTDMPEDDTYVAAPPTMNQNMRGIASVEQEEGGRNPASDEGGEVMAGTPPNAPTDVSARARTHKCNTLEYVKGILKDAGVSFPPKTGNAGASGPAWLSAHFLQISPPEANKDLDICIYTGGPLGNISIRSEKKWYNGCGTMTDDVPTFNGQHMLACYRPPAKHAKKR